MSKVGIELSIDVTKIDKSKLYQGKKGTYLSVTAFVDLDQLDQYGNSGMVTQKTTKEEQDQGIKGAILGNSKVFWKEGGNAPQQANQQQSNQGYSNQNPAPGFQQPGMAVGGNQSNNQFDDGVPF
ncbi:MAG: hypothetical protein GY920_02415 [Aliivibrio sp.]|nr:hypothetical protein [Aliivibrio sp.]